MTEFIACVLIARMVFEECLASQAREDFDDNTDGHITNYSGNEIKIGFSYPTTVPAEVTFLLLHYCLGYVTQPTMER